ncbi:MAG: hypothetical protein IT347_07165 [Candidatus Eisenbacteria bacterium]|nr:hypothetical protein [Candidatus Eisenbacteria bacterium]
MNDLSLHFAPNAPWIALALLSLVLVALAVWAYAFGTPPLPRGMRRLLAILRGAALVTLAWLLAQPVLDRALPAAGRRVTVLLDVSASMDLRSSPGGPPRSEVAARVAKDLAGALRGRASVQTRPFAATLAADTGSVARQSTALGDALTALAAEPVERRPDGVIVVSDGVVNAGADPVAAARELGVPVHTVTIGGPAGPDRAIAEVETSPVARVGEAAPVRVRVRSSEPRGTAIPVRVLEDGRELARATVPAPGPGAEAAVTLRVTPVRPGLAVWTARVDSLPGDASALNDSREAAVQVAPGRLGVLIVTGQLNWDLTFLRRALLGDSSLALETRVRERGGWRSLEHAGGPPSAADLRGRAVVILDALAAAEVSDGFDRALAAFVRGGGGLLLLGGPAPGLVRYSRGALAAELQFPRTGASTLEVRPQPSPAAEELLAWDDDPARGDAAWRAAAPLSGVMPFSPGGGDRVLVGAQGGGPPLVFARRAGRGPVLLVNGTGFWRWSLAGNDELAGERGRRLWRKTVRWLSEPVQGEPLRVRPERWLSANGERVRLFASLQDEAFRPVAGAQVAGTASDGRGASRSLDFEPGEAGSYTASLDALPPGRWQVSVQAVGGGRTRASATTAFAVDRWSLEALRSEPDSSTLGAIARASGGKAGDAGHADAWARGLSTRALTRRRAASTRLWESPWLFAALVAVLGTEWALRRRRGLP